MGEGLAGGLWDGGGGEVLREAEVFFVDVFGGVGEDGLDEGVDGWFDRPVVGGLRALDYPVC